MAELGFTAESPTSRGVRAFLSFCRMEKGLAQNSLDCVQAVTLLRLRLWAEPLTEGELPTEPVLRNYVNHLYAQKLSSRSIARHLSAIRSFFHFLVAEEEHEIDPTEHLSSPKQWTTIPKFLNRAQIEELIGAPDIGKPTGLRDRAMLELLYATGNRVTELIQLRLSSLDMELGMVRVTGKGNKPRLVPVHVDRAAKRSRDYASTRRVRIAAERPKTSSPHPLRDCACGGAMTRQAFWAAVKVNGKKAGIFHNLSPHVLRHTFATHLLDGGADLRSGRGMLGPRRSFHNREIYTHVGHARGCADTLDAHHPRA